MKRTSLLLASATLVASVADARVTRIEVTATTPLPAKDGRSAYEQVSGIFHGELDPRAPANRIITDLTHAPRNARGMVEYSASFAIGRPVDPTKASGVLYYEVPNRGYVAALEADQDGHVHVVSGWQGDLTPGPGLQWLKAPVATGITGPVLARFVNVPAATKSLALGAGMVRNANRPEPVSLDTAKARLVVSHKGKADQAIPASDWAFADCSSAAFPGKPDATQLCLKDGFEPEAGYTLIYTGKDPIVLGTGFAATRDLMAFLRSGKADDTGTPNPAGTHTRWTVGVGNSQSGNYLRSFTHLGFNADESGKRVFDGINPNIAARQIVLNLRFAFPGGAADLYAPGSEGTLWWGQYRDPRRGGARPSSLLDRCTASHTCPKIIETFGSAEFWGLRASPGLVGTDAKADIALPANVRRYYFPSVTHGGSFRGGFPAKGEGVMGSCLLPGNANPTLAQMRVARHALVDWVVEGKAPPASRYPTIRAGDLVAPNARAMGWHAIPGAPLPDGHINPFYDYEFGGGFIPADVSGAVTKEPPAVRRTMPQRVPRVNADGNETAGIPSVQLLVPLGTYTGWNVEAKGVDAGQNCGFAGGFVPFAKTKAEREAAHDQRPSLEERYGDHAGFVAKVRAAVATQQAAGWLMADDAAALIKSAEDSDILR